MQLIMSHLSVLSKVSRCPACEINAPKELVEVSRSPLQWGRKPLTIFWSPGIVLIELSAWVSSSRRAFCFPLLRDAEGQLRWGPDFVSPTHFKGRMIWGNVSAANKGDGSNVAISDSSSPEVLKERKSTGEIDREAAGRRRDVWGLGGYNEGQIPLERFRENWLALWGLWHFFESALGSKFKLWLTLLALYSDDTVKG